MRLYNSLGRVVEPFVPRGDEVTLYVCGITPYDTTHLGHAFTYLTVDVLVRYLEYLGHRVRYAQNVTDIDDDVLRKAGQVGEDWRDLGNRWTRHFIEDMQALNVRPPEYFPKATEMVSPIIVHIGKLLEAGVAYESEGSVYFDLAAWPRFGCLSQLPSAEMLPIANERGNNPHDPRKRDPLDFVLWQSRAPGEPSWDSPWGPGRPGWHIECSTMATQLLGEVVDIHAGGGDLEFPHHECEIAQVEPLTGGKPFVRFWMHVAMVHHQGQKMSKSLGNLVMVRDLLREWTSDALRVYLALHHYRSVWRYDVEQLRQAAERASKLRRAAEAPSGRGRLLDVHDGVRRFEACMDEDLNTVEALTELDRMADQILDASTRRGKVAGAQEVLRTLGSVFGLRLEATDADGRVDKGWRVHLERFR